MGCNEGRVVSSKMVSQVGLPDPHVGKSAACFVPHAYRFEPLQPDPQLLPLPHLGTHIRRPRHWDVGVRSLSFH